MPFNIKIRAHHLLCLQGYQGYGYNNRFTENLKEVAALIDTTPDLEAEIVTDSDLICEYCPHNGIFSCQKDENSSSRIKAMDSKVLEILGLKEGVRAKIQNFIALTNAKFKTYHDIQPVCGNCQWKEKCLWFQKFEPNKSVRPRLQHVN